MCHGIPDAIFENIGRHIVCDFFRRFCRISHCNTAACELQHIHIIDTVSHCNSICTVNSQKLTDTSDPGCFRIPLWDNLSNIVIVQQNLEILFHLLLKHYKHLHQLQIRLNIYSQELLLKLLLRKRPILY